MHTMGRALDAEIIVILRSRMGNVWIVIVVAILLLIIYRRIGGSGCLCKESIECLPPRSKGRYYLVPPLYAILGKIQLATLSGCK